MLEDRQFQTGNSGGELLFREEQNFLLALPIIGIFMTFLNLLFLYGIWRQIFMGQTFGDNPVSDGGLVVLFVFTFAITLLLWFLRLKTEIRTDGVYARFAPVHRQFTYFNPSDLEKCYLRKYKPIREFGGWGFRYSISQGGKAWNVSGNIGLQLVFKGGNKLLIGTRKPKSIKRALEQTEWYSSFQSE
ncbi:MAG: hypothetical protein EA409_01025 [Saprospirales bacterium]|nr:MAG: hypothetical protein EA409_01025 [Saprospirales bacterium]